MTKRIQWKQKSDGDHEYVNYAYAYIDCITVQIYPAHANNPDRTRYAWMITTPDPDDFMDIYEAGGECDTFDMAEQALIAAWDAYLSALVAEAAKVIVEVEG